MQRLDDPPDGAASQKPAPASSPGVDVEERLRTVAADLRGLQSFAAASAEADGMSEVARQNLTQLGGLAAQVEKTANSTDDALKATVLNAFGAQFVVNAETMARSIAATQGADIEGLQPHLPVAQRLESIIRADTAPTAPPRVQRQVAETLVLIGGGMVGTAEAAAPLEVATGPPGWVVGAALLVAGAALVGIGIYMASSGNQAHDHIVEEARELVRTSRAPDLCAALEMLMNAATDSQRKLKIKATQKALGCRHSRHS